MEKKDGKRGQQWPVLFVKQLHPTPPKEQIAFSESMNCGKPENIWISTSENSRKYCNQLSILENSKCTQK